MQFPAKMINSLQKKPYFVSTKLKHNRDQNKSEKTQIMHMLKHTKFRLTTLFLLVVAVVLTTMPSNGEASPKSACMRSCRVCKDLYGQHFQGHLCAHTCVRLRGRITPDCKDLLSIAPFLRPIESNSIKDT